MPQLKRFAINDELKQLYEKVVPPVATMEELCDKTSREVHKLAGIVAKYDENLCVKANKQELMAVDNKFRLHLKKTKFKEFKTLTETDYDEMKTDVNHVVQVVSKVTKNLE